MEGGGYRGMTHTKLTDRNRKLMNTSPTKTLIVKREQETRFVHRLVDWSVRLILLVSAVYSLAAPAKML